ncbi:MAG: helicase-exonuclease AddAB subunit AddA [Roseburia sp.]|nr:helicase-exonuclease AddAB subunit AddA [Roseburia sp.]MCM1241425.1 helicase-exonuclease AddAB subunit AddA [Roseburia sp.]
MGVTFTDQQQKVIDTHGCNLLVSAAAGSGKTAVLVERIVKMVSEGAHPVDIDRLLIVTFTNAAAAQMRERISNAIGDKLIKEPENEHLQRQMTLLHNAQITTIDSFCLFVIRNHFHTIGLDPGFRIADEGELKLLKNDVLAAVLESCYQKEEPAFLDCMEYFSTGNRDSAVEEAVLKLYEFAMSNPFPEDWLAERKKDYEAAGSAEELSQLDWMKSLLEETGLLLQGYIDRMSQCIALCEEPDGPYMYGELLEQEKEQIRRLLAAQTYEARYAAFTALSFGRLSSKKDETVSDVKRELVKNIRAEIKEKLQKMQKDFYAQSAEALIRQMEPCKEAVCALVEIALLFKAAFDETKREKNILDFDDVEHFALAILLKKTEDGRLEATETALEYRSYFTEILIDEYQDSNLVQEYLLSVISGEEQGNYNRFMVGDVKQSIYKFRLARPELFMEKYHTYGQEAGECTMRIDLDRNFRSRKQVLTAVNAFFSQVMRKELGGIDYDEKAALYPGASYTDSGANDTELLLFVGEDKETEASGIARRIKELLLFYQVTDSETGQLRPAAYKDIVILLRTTAGWDEEFKQVLEQEGIPVHVTSKSGYFAATEIQELLHFLRILDNPLQDIPFYGVAHSYFGGFTDEEIAMVKAACPKQKYLCDAFREYAGNEEDEETEKTAGESEAAEVRRCSNLQLRIRTFLEKIGRYRELAVYMAVHELLQTIIREYAYLSYVSARPGGSRRCANVEMLLVKAADYEKTSYYGLYHFLRYIEQLEKYDVDYGEANLQDENADVVRIMSIHKSKGLEFPICFVAGCAKSFNMRDVSGHLVMDVERGIGVDYVDPDKRIRSRNIRRNFIAAGLKKDNLAEELRILYVAMTRAREKLILTGTLKSPEKKIRPLMLLQNVRERAFSYDMLSELGSFLDAALYAMARNRCFDTIWQACGVAPDSRNPFYQEDMQIRAEILEWEDEAQAVLKEEIGRETNRRKLLFSDAGKDETRLDKELMTLMSEKFAWQYPYMNLKDLYTKTTVSELKKAGMMQETEFAFPLYEEEPIVPYLPKFIRQEESVSGTDRGSAFHKVMELFDFTRLLSAEGKADKKALVQAELDRMLAEGKLTQGYYDAVSVPKITAFMESEIAERMAKAAAAGKLHKEQPFVLGLPASRLNGDFPEDETVLIQGIIDVFFEEDGSYVVLDYKTDAVKSAEELVKRYKTQLDYYAEALEQLSGFTFTGKGKRTAQKVIYSFKLGQEILI